MTRAKEGWATARVQVTIEVPAGSWGGECSVDQVYKQARDSALGSIGTVIQRHKLPWRLVSEPVVTGVLTREGAPTPEPRDMAAPSGAPPIVVSVWSNLMAEVEKKRPTTGERANAPWTHLLDITDLDAAMEAVFGRTRGEPL